MKLLSWNTHKNTSLYLNYADDFVVEIRKDHKWFVTNLMREVDKGESTNCGGALAESEAAIRHDTYAR